MDDQEKPIVGATVYPYAMRAVEGDSHGYWNDELIGPPKTVVTDANGKAVIQYPVHIGSATEPRTTNLAPHNAPQNRCGGKRVVAHDLQG
jgi:hypothetical protein